MNKASKFAPVLMVVLAGIMSATLLSFSVNKSGAPQRSSADPDMDAPTWVRPDGTVDKSKLPECFEVADQNGNAVKNERGKPICISSKKLFAKPTGPPPQTQKEVEELNSKARQVETERRIVELPASSASNIPHPVSGNGPGGGR